jgi:hypothetical protein
MHNRAVLPLSRRNGAEALREQAWCAVLPRKAAVAPLHYAEAANAEAAVFSVF